MTDPIVLDHLDLGWTAWLIGGLILALVGILMVMVASVLVPTIRGLCRRVQGPTPGGRR